MSDKKTGYILLLAAVLIFAWLIGVGLYELLSTERKRIIVFEEVGNLEIQDKVFYNGLIAGSVKKMENFSCKTAVTVIFDRSLPIYENYSIYTSDKGLMGDRQIVISPGDSTRRRLESGDTLRGEFFIGVSEALGMAWKLENGMQKIVPMIIKLARGTKDSPSFTRQFNSILYAIDSLSFRLGKATVVANGEIEKQLTIINSAISNTQFIVEKISRGSEFFIRDTRQSIQKIESFIDKLSVIVEMLEDILRKLESSQLVECEDIAKNVNNAIGQLEGIIDDMQRGAARLRLIISRLKE